MIQVINYKNYIHTRSFNSMTADFNVETYYMCYNDNLFNMDDIDTLINK